MSDLYKFLPSIIEFRYSQRNAKLVQNAIRTLFSLEHRIFSGGVYIYFSLKKEDSVLIPDEILYVGETGNYSKRFGNHNFDSSAPGNKRAFIDAHFLNNQFDLGLYLFAFKRPVSSVEFYSNKEDEIDHERSCILLDDHFSEYRNYFERIIVREFKNIKGRNPPWFEDRDRITFSGDEPMIQAKQFVQWIYGHDDASLDYYMEDGFKAAQKMQEAVFQKLRVT